MEIDRTWISIIRIVISQEVLKFNDGNHDYHDYWFMSETPKQN